MLDYLATNPNAKVRFYPSNMLLNVHFDVSYVSAKDAKSLAAGHIFLGWEPDDKRPIRINRPITPPKGQEGITHVQKLVGTILYYTRSVDSTPLVALNTIVSKQAHTT